MTVAVLFAQKNSVYKTLDNCDVWDIERDARKWPGGTPAIAHPPCRAWGNFAQWAKARENEKELAPWAINQVRKNGGIVEHPITSKLWKESGCLDYGIRDQHGGILIPVNQSWWGHRAPKKTGLYIVGPLPELPYEDRQAQGRIELMGKPERERTPEAFARWLIATAEQCKK